MHPHAQSQRLAVELFRARVAALLMQQAAQVDARVDVCGVARDRALVRLDRSVVVLALQLERALVPVGFAALRLKLRRANSART